MIEVILYRADREVSRAEADTPENAIFAARTLLDDEYAYGTTAMGWRRFVRHVFLVDGKMVRMVEGGKL